MRAEHFDGEDLADLVSVLPTVHRRREKHSPTGDETAENVGILSAEVGELQEVLPVEQEHLGHAATVHSRPVGKADIQGAWPRAGDLELRDDATPTGEYAERELLLGALAIRLDRKSRPARWHVEEDGSAVEKVRTADRVRVVRKLASLAGSRVEAEDLLRVVPLPVGAEVDQRDAQAVGADRAVFVIVRLNAAGRTETEPPEPPPVGAHEEKALLRQPPDSWERKPQVVNLEDNHCDILQQRQALKV